MLKSFRPFEKKQHQALYLLALPVTLGFAQLLNAVGLATFP